MGEAREAKLDALARELQHARALDQRTVEVTRGRSPADIALTGMRRLVQAQSAIGVEPEEGPVLDRVERARVVPYVVVELQQDEVVEHRRPGVDVGDLTADDAEPGREVHPRVDLDDAERAIDRRNRARNELEYTLAPGADDPDEEAPPRDEAPADDAGRKRRPR